MKKENWEKAGELSKDIHKKLGELSVLLANNGYEDESEELYDMTYELRDIRMFLETEAVLSGDYTDNNVRGLFIGSK